MTTLLQAAKQALEALEYGLIVMNDSFKEKPIDEAITALREALEQPVSQEPVAWMRLNEKGICEAIEYIGDFDEHLYLPPSCQWLYTSPVLTMQQVEPKPVAKVGHLHQSIVEACGLPMSTPLYTAPQPVKEVDLTDDDLNNAKRCLPLYLSEISEEDLDEFARAVIAAYKEKQRG